MTTIMLKEIREDVNKALIEVGKKYNMQMHLGNISYDECGFKGKLIATLNDIDGKHPTQVNFEKYCNIYGLDVTDYNKEFTRSGKTFIVKDIKVSSRKYPILCECKQDGKMYKFVEDDVKRLIS